jgi:hypothetical protein
MQPLEDPDATTLFTAEEVAAVKFARDLLAAFAAEKTDLDILTLLNAAVPALNSVLDKMEDAHG